MQLEEVLGPVKEGACARRKSWSSDKEFIYKLKGVELQRGLRYGFGEYQGEPTFTNTLVLRNSQNHLVVGWIPSMDDIFATDWELLE